MIYTNVCIEAFTYYSPKNIITSAQLENQLAPLYKRLKLPQGRLELISGIKERRLWDAGTTPSQASTLAGQKALQQANIPPEQIDCLLHCSVSRDFVEPATSTQVHRNLKLPTHALNFDISNACLGVLSGIITIANMIQLGQIKTGIIVAGEQSQGLLDGTIHRLNTDTTLTRKTIKNYFASLTIGSCAAAVILTHDSISKHNHKLLGGAYSCNTNYNHLCQGESDTDTTSNHNIQMNTNSQELLIRGIDVAEQTWKKYKTNLNWQNQTADVICCHQVGREHQKALYQRLQLDPNKDFSTFTHWGNCGSASLPATTALAIEKNKIKTGDHVALLGIGSGINCTMLGLKW